MNSPNRITARQLARLAGKIISTKFVLGNVVRLRTRFLYRLIESRVSWDKTFNVLHYNEVVNEILFWKFNLCALNKRPIIKYNIPQLKVFSDASSTGIGAFYDQNISYRNLDNFEIDESSTFRELLAIKHSLESFDSSLQNKHVLWHTDNIGAAQIIRVGSNRILLQKLALEIYTICHKNDILLTVTWISRKLNQVADKISKSIDYDDWTIKNELFCFIERLWGKLTIGLFADNNNKKCKRFCSRYWCPGVLKVDAFSFDWTGERCLMVPPTYLISRCIKHFLASKSKVSGVLVVPFWPSALFWPLLVDNFQTFKNFIVDYRFFESSKDFLSQGQHKGSIIGDPEHNVPILVLLLKK